MFTPSHKPLIRLSLPLITVVLALIAVAAHAYGPVGDWLVYDRTQINNGEAWRLLTGHLTHWSADHLLWDAVMFLVLGVMVEQRHRIGLILTVIASAAAITVVLWLGHAEVAEYRGLSGIDSALFTHAAILLYHDGRRLHRPLIRRMSVVLLVAFAAKVVYEIASGNTLFVDSSDFVSLANVHAVGGLVGAVSAFCMSSRVSRNPSSSDRGRYPNSRRALELSAR